LSAQPKAGTNGGGFVAVDFGTSVSRIAYTRGDGSALVTDMAGDACIPSVLAVSPEGGVLAGGLARDRQALYPEHTVLSLKSLLTADLTELEERGTLFPHKVGPATALQFEIGGRARTWVELAALYLSQLRRTAEVSLERPVRAGVITVPVSYSPFDRQAVRLAARMAGFSKVRAFRSSTSKAGL